MEALSPTLSQQRRLLTETYNVHQESSINNWQALLAAADKINQSALEELTQLKSELAELMSLVMKLSLPVNRLCELNAEIEARAQSFMELNAIRIDAQQQIKRARQALASENP